MSIEERKALLVSLILTSDEEELISLLEEDVTEYGLRKQKSVDEDLSSEELAELNVLAADENPGNYITLEEFNLEMDKWRSQ